MSVSDIIITIILAITSIIISFKIGSAAAYHIYKNNTTKQADDAIIHEPNNAYYYHDKSRIKTINTDIDIIRDAIKTAAIERMVIELCNYDSDFWNLTTYDMYKFKSASEQMVSSYQNEITALCFNNNQISDSFYDYIINSLNSDQIFYLVNLPHLMNCYLSEKSDDKHKPWKDFTWKSARKVHPLTKSWYQQTWWFTRRIYTCR